MISRLMLIFSLVFPAAIDAAVAETWMVWCDSSQTNHPVYLSELKDGYWAHNLVPESLLFSLNYRPAAAIGGDGVAWLLWAAQREGDPPRVHFARRRDGFWLPAEPVSEDAGLWEASPAVALDLSGRPWAVWSRIEGESSEIFCAAGEDGRFGPAIMVSSPDGSPDSNPAIACGAEGDPVIAWESFARGRAQVFISRFTREGWTPEKALNPDPGADQVFPAVYPGAGGGLSVEWEQGGSLLAGELARDGKFRLLPSPGKEAGFSSPVPPEAEASAWILRKDPDGNLEQRRYRSLNISREAGKGGPGGAAATYQYVGYGDIITCGHNYCSDTNGWYGSLLKPMLESEHPGDTYQMINEGFPRSSTHDLLYSGGPDGCPGIDAVLNSYFSAEKFLIMAGTSDIEDGVPLSTIKFNLGEMIDRTRAKGIEPVLGTIIPRCDHQSNFNNCSSLREGYILVLAEEKDCVLADPWLRYIYYYDNDPDYFWQSLYGYPDHYNGISPYWPTGDQEIANAWFDALEAPTPTPAPSSSPAPSASASASPSPVSLVLDSGDYNGDGTSDIAVFRDSSGLWAISGFTRVYFGAPGDLPVCGDYNNDGTSEIAILRRSQALWAVRNLTRLYFGGASDLPVPGDYNGDGLCDMGVFRPGTALWAIRNITRLYFGGSGDRPVPGYYRGDRAKDIAVFRSSNALWALRDITRIYFGQSADEPVPAGYLSGETWLPAVFRPATNLWAVRNATRLYFGASGDRPVPADFSGDNTEDIGIFRKINSLWAIRDFTRVYFGSSSDLPVAARVPRPVTPTPQPSPTAQPPTPTPTVVPPTPTAVPPTPTVPPPTPTAPPATPTPSPVTPSPVPTCSVSCEYRASGTITDKNTTLPIAGSDVTIQFADGQTDATTSGGTGAYSFWIWNPHVAGTVTIEATHADYLPGYAYAAWQCMTVITGLDIELIPVATPTPMPMSTPTPTPLIPAPSPSPSP